MNTALSVTDSQIPTYPRPLSAEEVRQIDAYWRAANYLSVGQIYLLDNPLLRDPLTASHIKPRLLGHWGTTPGLNIIYAHLNRIIRQRDTNVMLVTGPDTAARGGGQHLPGRQLQPLLRTHRPRPGRLAKTVQAILLPWRHSQPYGSGDTRLDPRRRRARVRAGARIWRRLG
ncbi:XFP N-terminal domain protein [Mycobacteroides abscessus 21]|uniref:XFP N-terminal domain protein n=1 Tax=Mycobacteroides abscessus 21 TaxID=1299324 RepID=A0A829Q490_9MYCO|nr:XFP N-terminal domain protein [Mycobacteroides abscessus 21]